MSGLVTTSVSDDGKPILPKSRPANAAFAPVFTTSIPSIRRYQPGGVLAYTYNIYNAKPDNAAKKPKLTRQIRLYKSGKLILEGKETPVDAQPQTDVSRVQDFGVIRLNQDVQIGEYILQIVVRDTIADKTVSQWIDFEVVP